MATALQFRTEQAANSILKADKKKLDWAILDLNSCPKDIAEQAVAMQNYDMLYRQTKAIVEAMLGDKAVIPTGKRLIVTVGRGTDPASPAPVMYALADGGSARSTPVVSFDQFIKAHS